MNLFSKGLMFFTHCIPQEVLHDVGGGGLKHNMQAAHLFEAQFSVISYRLPSERRCSNIGNCKNSKSCVAFSLWYKVMRYPWRAPGCIKKI